MIETTAAEAPSDPIDPGKTCTHCKERPRRAPKQRWCRECHADYVRFRRQGDIERANYETVDHRPRAEYREWSGVYFLYCQGFIKIGLSCNIVARFGAIKTANPHTVVPIGFVRETNPARLDALEAGIHDVLHRHVHRGEWFVCNREVLHYIAASSEPWPWETFS